MNATTLTASSPVQQRRDSILKHQGSVKTDKRVSINPTPNSNNSNNNNPNNKVNNLSNIEYVSEKTAASNSAPAERRGNKPPSGPRPASLVITKNDNKGSHFKLVRSSSVDYDDIESQLHPKNVNRIVLADQLQEEETAPLVFTVHK